MKTYYYAFRFVTDGKTFTAHGRTHSESRNAAMASIAEFYDKLYNITFFAFDSLECEGDYIFQSVEHSHYRHGETLASPTTDMEDYHDN